MYEADFPFVVLSSIYANPSVRRGTVPAPNEIDPIMKRTNGADDSPDAFDVSLMFDDSEHRPANFQVVMYMFMTSSFQEAPTCTSISRRVVRFRYEMRHEIEYATDNVNHQPCCNNTGLMAVAPEVRYQRAQYARGDVVTACNDSGFCTCEVKATFDGWYVDKNDTIVQHPLEIWIILLNILRKILLFEWKQPTMKGKTKSQSEYKSLDRMWKLVNAIHLQFHVVGKTNLRLLTSTLTNWKCPLPILSLFDNRYNHGHNKAYVSPTFVIN